jgi:ABC-type sugar transport system ATPase subunit
MVSHERKEWQKVIHSILVLRDGHILGSGQAGIPAAALMEGMVK